jgi:hypothetical protein
MTKDAIATALREGQPDKFAQRENMYRGWRETLPDEDAAMRIMLHDCLSEIDRQRARAAEAERRLREIREQVVELRDSAEARRVEFFDRGAQQFSDRWSSRQDAYAIVLALLDTGAGK